jgi:microcystin-dependent protein
MTLDASGNMAAPWIVDNVSLEIAGGTTLQVKNNALVPVGSVLMFAGNAVTPPAGYLYCDGSPLSTTAYSGLFSVIGYAFGGAGGTFNLPNTKGVFIRGAGSQTVSGTTYTGTFASALPDAYPAHNHGGGNHTHSYITHLILACTGTGGAGFAFDVGGTTGASGTIIATNGSGTETQPANLTLNYIIKY